MRIFLLSALLSVSCLAANAQSPVSAYAPTANPSSSNFVMANPLAKHNQTLYPPDLTDMRSGLITKLYFKYGSSSSLTGNTIDSLRISLGQTDSLNLRSAGLFKAFFLPATELTRVYTRAQTAVPAGAVDNWFALALDAPFRYDSTRSLVLDIRFNNSSNQVFGVRSETVDSRRLRVYADTGRGIAGSTSSFVPHLGIDIPVVATRPSLSGLGLLVPNPLPATAAVAIPATLQGKEFVLTDASGKAVHRERLGASLRISGLPKGLYMLRVEGVGQRLIVE